MSHTKEKINLADQITLASDEELRVKYLKKKEDAYSKLMAPNFQ